MIPNEKGAKKIMPSRPMTRYFHIGTVAVLLVLMVFSSVTTVIATPATYAEDESCLSSDKDTAVSLVAHQFVLEVFGFASRLPSQNNPNYGSPFLAFSPPYRGPPILPL